MDEGNQADVHEGMMTEGSVIAGAYRVVRLLGVGGMGAVYEARRIDDGHPVAVKILPAEFTVSQEARARMRREIGLCRRVNHPHVIRFLDGAIPEEGAPYLVMELLKGRDLQETTVEEFLSDDDARRVLTQMADALVYLHRHGLIHRDIKPANIFLQPDGRAVLLDFGLACAPDVTRMTGTGDLLGTLGYMAPEQLAGTDSSPASDLYSLGAALYEALTGSLPYSRSKAMRICAGQRVRPPQPPHELRPDISPHVSKLVMWCLEIEPEMRIASANLLAKALQDPSLIPSAQPIAETIDRPSVTQEERPATVRLRSVDRTLSYGGQPATASGEERSSDSAVVVGGAAETRRVVAVALTVTCCLIAVVALGLRLLFPASPSAADRPHAPFSIPVAGSQDLEQADPHLPPENARPGDEWVNAIGLSFVWVPAGSFLQGSPDHEEGRRDHEGPQRQVEISEGFWMGRHQVTQQEYEELTGGNPAHFTGANRPVEMVSWEDAVAFVDMLTALDRRIEYRVPTEAEWEYACRAGTTTRYHVGDHLSPEDANVDGAVLVDGRPTTVEAGTYPPNAWGLTEMHGNVFEWCADWFDPGFYAVGPAIDPVGPESGTLRVVRGGSWYATPESSRSAHRTGIPPRSRVNHVGFRITARRAVERPSARRW